MKEEMEALEIAAAVRDMECLVGGYIQKAYQLSNGDILFKIHVSGEGKRSLRFRMGKGLYITYRDIETPLSPSHYIMLLRKFVGNARITYIKQHEFDRVVVMGLAGRQPMKLVFELFGKGNLVLVGEEHIILPLRSETWRHRTLKEGEDYRFPPSRRQPFELDEDEVSSILEGSNADLVRTLAVEFNLGGKYAEEICARMGLDKNTEELVELAGDIFREIQEVREKVFFRDLEPLVVKSQDDIIDAVPFSLIRYSNMETDPSETYNHALDEAFGIDENEVSKGPSSIERRLETQKRSVENMEEKVSESMLSADLIYQNYAPCEKILESILRGRDEGNREEVFQELKQNEEVIDINDLEEYVILQLSGMAGDEKTSLKVRLDFRKDVNENAQKYYQLAKKNKKKIEGAKEAIKRTEQDIKKGFKEDAKNKSRKKPTVKYWFDRYKWFISSEGCIVVAGRDTKTNEEVVKKYLERNDIYAHADAGGAPSVVIKSNRGYIGEATLREACQFAVIHSKEWKRGIASGTAYWVYPDQVSKTAESGESLPTGAFVIRGKRNYVKDIPMKAALVETSYQDKRKVMCAPGYTLDSYIDNKQVLFVPGDRNPGDFSKEMSNHFKVPITEIQKILPPGSVNIVEKKG